MGPWYTNSAQYMLRGMQSTLKNTPPSDSQTSLLHQHCYVRKLYINDLKREEYVRNCLDNGSWRLGVHTAGHGGACCMQLSTQCFTETMQASVVRHCQPRPRIATRHVKGSNCQSSTNLTSNHHDNSAIILINLTSYHMIQDHVEKVLTIGII